MQSMEMLRRLRDVIPIFFLVIFLLVCSVPNGECQPGPPPTLIVNRDWRIPEDEQVGARVSHAQVRDNESRKFKFNILPSEIRDISEYFRIDSSTGSIYLKASLKGKGGSQGNLYVAVQALSEDDEVSSIRARIEVLVHIDPPSTDGSSGHVTSNIMPPYVPPILYPPKGVVPPPPPIDRTPPVQIPQLTTVSPQYPNNKTTPKEDGKTLNTTIISVKPLGNSVENNDVSEVEQGGNVTNEITNGNIPYDVGQKEKGNQPPKTNLPGQEDTSPEIHNNSLGISANDPFNPTVATDVNPSETDGSTIALVAVIPIVVVFGVVPIVLGTLWLLKKRSRVKKRPTKEIRKESAATTASNVTMSGEGDPPSALTQWVGKRAQSNRYESWDPDAVPPQVPNRWEFPRHHLQIGGILGEGCFGQVWRAEALNIDGKDGTTTVAVKTLKESAGERERADLLSELTVMKMLDPHPNVVRLLGCCTEKDPIFVIMEYVAMGKLQSYLRNSRAQHYYGNLHGDSSSLSSKDLTSFAHQVARGMEYLASKGIIHRDLAARNILIDKERVCKVADFGFARDVVANHVYERKSDGRLPIRWMAPEALYDNIFTTKTDVWSFGVLMWEIVTLGSTPYPGMAAGEVMRKVRDGYRLEKPEHCRRELYNIMFYCWAHNSDDRPTFHECAVFLRKLLSSETDYIELDRFPEHDYYNVYNESKSVSGEKL